MGEVKFDSEGIDLTGKSILITGGTGSVRVDNLIYASSQSNIMLKESNFCATTFRVVGEM